MTLSLETDCAIDSGDVYSCAQFTRYTCMNVGVVFVKLSDISEYAMIQSPLTAVAKIPSEMCVICVNYASEGNDGLSLGVYYTPFLTFK